jgi:prepilin-type N-terminal cleavage/methylation domain-containing protein
MLDKRKFLKGFSLIELLVVISIIGILVAILVLNFDEARKHSRDSVRKSDLQALQLAIELYKSQNGVYPARGCGATTGWVGPGPNPWGPNCSEYIAGLVPDYIAALPTDPNQEQDSGKGYLYTTDATGSLYKVVVHKSVESDLITSFADQFARCPKSCGPVTSGGICNTAPQTDVYAVYSPGAECQ